MIFCANTCWEVHQNSNGLGCMQRHAERILVWWVKRNVIACFSLSIWNLCGKDAVSDCLSWSFFLRTFVLLFGKRLWLLQFFHNWMGCLEYIVRWTEVSFILHFAFTMRFTMKVEFRKKQLMCGWKFRVFLLSRNPFGKLDQYRTFAQHRKKLSFHRQCFNPSSFLIRVLLN